MRLIEPASAQVRSEVKALLDYLMVTYSFTYHPKTAVFDDLVYFFSKFSAKKISHFNLLLFMGTDVKVVNWFQCKAQPSAQELEKQQLIKERIEKLQTLADTYNFHDDPMTLRIFGDLKSGIGFSIDCPKPQLKDSVTKILRMYLNSCDD